MLFGWWCLRIAEPGYPTRRRVSSPGVRPGWTMNRATAAARHRSEGKARIAGPRRFEVDRHAQRIALELESWLSSHPSSLNKCLAREVFIPSGSSTRARSCNPVAMSAQLRETERMFLIHSMQQTYFTVTPPRSG